MTKLSKNKTTSVKLPNHISPTHYNLSLKPDINSSTFSGKEIIKIKVEKDTNKIIIHSKDLDIETVKYTSGKIEQFASKVLFDNAKETAIFIFKNKIKKGNGELSIVFSGILNESLRGFYKSKYIIDGKEKHIATTQFESTDARRAFPCFDEPAKKAIFEVSLIVPNSHTAISNTLPINITAHEGEYKIVSFSPTPIMSTYLLAFIVGEFESIEKKTKQGVQVRVFTTKGKVHQGRFALDVAVKSLEFFTEYFDIPYPMPNLDLIAIPDFEAAGMENWGAITYRESSVLIDEEHSSIINKQWVATTVAHEIAHQWFGNLVTMHWWTDLWLNEGFASYMEKVCTNELFPHWKIWDLHLSGGRYLQAIEIDSLKNSHPIEVELHHPDEINEAFDMVSYEKGTAVIRMLCEYIGENKFKEGLRYYLKKHSYKNTKTVDLWNAFEKVSKKPISKIMDSWVKQAGFPVISIQSNKSGTIITQEKFFSSRKTRKENTKNYLWEIPLVYKNNNKEKIILINKKKNLIKDKNIHKINEREISFLKVQYDDETLNIIKNEIINNHISTTDKLSIIRDLFALAQGGYIKTSKALEFSLCFKNETEYIVWAELSYGINKIFNLIDNEEMSSEYSKYALSLFSPLSKKVGFEKSENEKSSDTLLRILALSQSAFYGDKETIKEALIIFKNRLIVPIDSDIKSTIYNIVAQNGKNKEWNNFRKLHKEATLQEEKERLSRAMTKFKNETLLEKTLEFSLSKEIRDQDAPFLIASTWNNKIGRNITFKFLQDNWDTILKKYGEGGLFLSKLLYSLGNHNSLKDLKDAKKFFSKNIAPGAERTLEQAYERIESNAAWIKDDKNDIRRSTSRSTQTYNV